MTTTIAISNLKGGTGKTTTAMLTATALTRIGYSVTVIDLDPQGSATEWDAIATDTDDRLPFRVVPGNAHSIRRLPASDFVLLDCPPGNSTLIDAAIDASDSVIIPVSPSPTEVTRMWDALDLASTKPRKVLLTSVVLNTKNLDALERALAAEHMPTFRVVIPRREAIRSLYGHTPVGDLGGYESVARELLSGGDSDD